MSSVGAIIPSGRDRLRAGLGLLALAACCAWAAWPIRDVPPPTASPPKHTGATTPTRQAVPPFEASAFSAKLWNPPAPVQTAAALPPTPPPPPLRLQLIAIVRTEGASQTPALRAAIYDPDADTLLVAAPGDAVAGFRVGTVTESAIDLVDARTPSAPPHRIELEPDGPARERARRELESLLLSAASPAPGAPR